MQDAEAAKLFSQELKQTAMQRARNRANAERWSRDITVFSFAVLVIVIILLYQGVVIEIVAPIAVLGLAAIWLVGWRQGRQLYMQFFSEELSRLEQEVEKIIKETEEEPIEEKVRKAMRDMWR